MSWEKGNRRRGEGDCESASVLIKLACWTDYR
jgi:hypothetical protein